MIVKSVKVFKNKVIKNKKGSLIKFINKSDLYFKSFGEIYFSEIKANSIKGWNYHKKFTCIMTVPVGTVEFKIINQRNKLLKKKITRSQILVIPPKHWFCFKSGHQNSIVANLLDGKHSEKETKKKNLLKNIHIK
tara:strand:+ start:3799 stop:4203 length:405 start_codon:yes stop_codon:yes gene_type:complete